MLKTTPKLTLGSFYGIKIKLLIKLLPESASPTQAVAEDAVSVCPPGGRPSAFWVHFTHLHSSWHRAASEYRRSPTRETRFCKKLP